MKERYMDKLTTLTVIFARTVIHNATVLTYRTRLEIGDYQEWLK